MAKKRTDDPWMPAAKYGRALPRFMVNLLMRDVRLGVEFYQYVLGARCRYQDEDFAAIDLNGAELMLHADHTYEVHPWVGPLSEGQPRGLGAELRLFGLDPDQVEANARQLGARVLAPATTKGHGWREVWVQDPAGYVWAVGESTPTDS